ncbi:AMIN-like domain-containing (lipo)protein [Nocardia lijiangensis]|uniref:AMIN-like domain-containing (lipo)protein n=1 Tax=Nocardia lijiangensis TaxID=299618 RepID=UPI003D75E273
MRRFLVLISALVAGIGFSIIPNSALAAPSYCGLVWGSLDQSDPSHSTAQVTNVRSGRHQCFDRLVIDVAGPVTGYRAAYVDSVTMDASGAPVPLRGDAFLSMTVNAPAYNDAGSLTYHPADRGELARVGGYQTFRQVAWAGSFEGQTTFGLGVRARLPFRVFTLDGPGGGSRVVLDVAHFW